MKVPSDVVQQRCQKLIQHLEEFPKTFDMSQYMYGHKIDAQHPCGTIGCLAGTLVFLEDGPLSGKVTHDEWDPTMRTGFASMEIAARARELLEIDGSASHKLFYASDWPEHLRKLHMDEDGFALPADFTAADGIARIEYFLETGE